MISPADDTIRCTPRSTTADVRPASFHGTNALTSILAVGAAPSLVGYLFLVRFNPFVAVGVLISLLLLYLVLFAVPFDQAKASRPVEWTLTPLSVTRTVPGVTTTVDWTRFQCLVIGRRVVILHAREASTCLVLPRRCLTAGQLANLVDWTRGQNVTVRATRWRLRSDPELVPANRP